MDENASKNKQFYLGALLISWLAWIPYGASQTGLLDTMVPWEFVLLGQFGPTVTAIFLISYYQGGRGLKDFFRRTLNFRFEVKWIFIPLLIPPAISLIILLLYWIFGLDVPSLNDFLDWPEDYAKDYGTGGPYTLEGALVPNLGFVDYLKTLIMSSPLAAIVIFLLLTIITGPLSEEFGWRGFMLPNLYKKYSMLKSSIFLGILWGFWHTGPDFWTYVFEAKVYAIVYPIAITIGTIPLSILFTWVYLNAKGSLWPIFVFHASFNGSLYILTLVWESQSAFITSAELTLGLWILSVIVIWKGGLRAKSSAIDFS